MSLRQRIFDGLVPTQYTQKVRHKEGDTDDIVETILFVDKESHIDTAEVAHLLKRGSDWDTAKRVWQFVRRNVRYVKDPDGHEKVKLPSRTLTDGFGDCKSFSIAIASFLKNLGIPVWYRFTGYEDDTNVTHVYLVALLDGYMVPIDGTSNVFGMEDETYTLKYDRQAATTKVSVLRGLPEGVESKFTLKNVLLGGLLLWGINQIL